MTLLSRSSLLALLTLALVGLFGCGESSSSSAASQLDVEDFEFALQQDGTRLFSGKVYNPTAQPVKQVQIRVSLLDAENRQVGSTVVSVNNIAANGRTSFRQPLDSDEEDVDGAKVKSLTVM